MYSYVFLHHKIILIMHKFKLLGLSILSGLLMGIAWPETGSLSILIFIAFVPLLLLEEIIASQPERYSKWHLFFYTYLTFLIFNTYTTWWIWYSSEAGMVMAEVLYSLFMTIIFMWFHTAKKHLGNKRGYIALIAFWVGFEWVHYNWEFSHPWNTLGNVFANNPKWIQWYEYTGVMGGSLWILLMNIVVYHFYQAYVIRKESFLNNIKMVIVMLVLLLAPMIYSYNTYSNYVKTENPIEVVVVQPNIDPYKDKFGRMTEDEQIANILQLAQSKITQNTTYVVAPETAIPRGFVETKPEESNAYRMLQNWLKNNPHITLIIGASTYREYKASPKKPTPTARPDRQTGGWYDAYNTALQMKNEAPMQIYHKSKLVLGVEKLPYPKVFSPLEKFAINLGGTLGSLGSEKEAFNLINDKINIAPVICYESIYGEYFGTYVQKGAHAAFIITNDGWWDDSPGYKQHLAYGRLRAIETRRSIARSANTGISCFINQRGDVRQPIGFWQKGVIKGDINLNTAETFYVRSGDWIGRVLAALSVLLLVWSWGAKIKNKSNFNF